MNDIQVGKFLEELKEVNYLLKGIRDGLEQVSMSIDAQEKAFQKMSVNLYYLSMDARNKAQEKKDAVKTGPE